MAAGGRSHSLSFMPTWAAAIGLSRLLTKKEEEEINEVGAIGQCGGQSGRSWRN